MSSKRISEISDEIWSLIKDGKCVAWLGAGLSSRIYPDWETTIRTLCDTCSVVPLTPAEGKSPDALINKAEECKLKNHTAYIATLSDLFGGPVVNTRQAYNYIFKLPFQSYITTNYDPLLSHAAGLHNTIPVNSYPDLNVLDISENEKSVFYIHGLARDGSGARGDNLVLAKSEFDEAYGRDSLLNSLLTAVLTYRPILFLGCRLTEPSIKKAFERVREIHMQIQNKHEGTELPLPRRSLLLSTQLVKSNEKKENEEYKEEDIIEEERRFKEMDIDIITCLSISEKHEELELILEQVCEKAKTSVIPKYKILGESLPS